MNYKDPAEFSTIPLAVIDPAESGQAPLYDRACNVIYWNGATIDCAPISDFLLTRFGDSGDASKAVSPTARMAELKKLHVKRVKEIEEFNERLAKQNADRAKTRELAHAGRQKLSLEELDALRKELEEERY